MEVLYTILIGSGVPMKLVRLIKLRLNETCSKVRVGKHLSENMRGAATESRTDRAQG
jgi:hypothetical protein